MTYLKTHRTPLLITFLETICWLDLGFQSALKASEAESEADLNVDGDDNAIYGRPQYTEGDVIPCTADEPSEAQALQALRGAVVGYVLESGLLILKQKENMLKRLPTFAKT